MGPQKSPSGSATSREPEALRVGLWPLRGKVKIAAIVVASVALIAAGAVVVLALLRSTSPVAVEGLTGAVNRDDLTVEFSWENPDPRLEDTYVWADTTPGRDASTHDAEVASVALPIGIEGQVCVTVQTVRGDQSSPTVERCVEVDFYVADGAIQDPVTLTVAYWGKFGLTESTAGPSLVSQYEESHPWIDLQMLVTEYPESEEALVEQLAAGSGAPSIAMLDRPYLPWAIDLTDGFVNLRDLGADEYRERYSAWTWDEAATADGSAVIGLGYDSAGLALCYRSDLFQEAGLPYEREEVSAEVGDNWVDFIAFGERYVEATGKPFVDSATSIFWPAVIQQGMGYAFYDRSDRLDMANVKPAFDSALEVIEAGLSANIPTLTNEWYAALSSGDFAVTLCPSWLLPIMSGNLRQDFAGQWDLADIPGPGGEWGGSFMAIPNQGTEREQQEAWAFIEWLIEPEQALRIVQETGNLPGQSALLDSDEAHGLTNAVFNDAPYGTVLAKTVQDIPAGVYLAPNTGIFRSAMEWILDEVQAGNISAEDAWGRAMQDAEYHDGEEGPDGP